MTIDWAVFTPWSSLAGGVLIGLAAAIYVLFNGRIAGVSGLLGGLFDRQTTDKAWRIAFLFGLIITPTIFMLFGHAQYIPVESNYFELILAGLLVGIGTSMGSGCTSGHGVCGIARLSPRSLMATVVFMLAGFITVYFMRHLLGL